MCKQMSFLVVLLLKESRVFVILFLPSAENKVYESTFLGGITICGHLLVIDSFEACKFFGNVTSQEICLPGKPDYPGNMTSQEIRLPGKFDFQGK